MKKIIALVLAINAPIFAAEKSSAAPTKTTPTLLAAALQNAEPKVGDTIQEKNLMKRLKQDETLPNGLRIQTWKIQFIGVSEDIGGFTQINVIDLSKEDKKTN